MPHDYRQRLLMENFNLGLIFPSKGVVFFRIKLIDEFTYLYDRVLTEGSVSTAGQISANEYLSAFVLENSSGDGIIEVEDDNHIYHLFYGIAPSALRTYLYVPSQTARRAPDVETIVTRSKWGYIDGFESPFSTPSPRTELFLPEGANIVAFAIWNPLTIPIVDPLLWFVGANYEVEPIKNVAMIEGMLKGMIPMRLATVGGIEPMDYDTKKRWKVDAIPLNATRQVIEAAVKG
ncbi:MAG: hypothetical protein WC935_09345 [Thermoleophilia bacterium]